MSPTGKPANDRGLFQLLITTPSAEAAAATPPKTGGELKNYSATAISLSLFFLIPPICTRFSPLIWFFSRTIWL